MYYSEDLIEEIRSRNDIVDVISSYVKLKKQGSSYFGLCPFHNEKSPSFSVSGEKQMFYCFGCGEGGNVFTFIMKYENYSFQEALKYLADRAGIALPEADYSEEAKKGARLKEALLAINNEAGKMFHYLLKTDKGKDGLEYLKKRGLSDETIIHFGLGYSGKYSGNLYPYLKNKGFTDEQLKESGLFTFEERGVKDKFWNRVMFPIMDVNNRVIGFGGRVMGDAKPKYLNSPETKLFDKSRNLYGLNFARAARKNELIICEGYMDVIALHQAGFTNAVAALGTSFTSGHASLLKRYADTVLLSFDSDGAGVKAALRAIPILKEAGLSVKIIDMKPYKDPDEFIKALGREEYQKRIRDAQNCFIFEVRQMAGEYDMSDPDEKAEFTNKTAMKILKVNDEVQRSMYIEAVANEFMISLDLLKGVVKKKALYYNGEKEEIQKKEERKRFVKPVKDNKVRQSQKILLTWMIEEPQLYQKIKNYISPKEFIEPLYHKVSEMLFLQMEEGQVNPAKIISCFEEEEEQKEVAGLFHAHAGEGLDAEKKNIVLNETVRNVKQNYLEYEQKRATDIGQLQKLIQEQTKLQNMHISLE